MEEVGCWSHSTLLCLVVTQAWLCAQLKPLPSSGWGPPPTTRTGK